MASRYGRKKRRQAREQIAALEHLGECQREAIRMDRALLSRQRGDLERLRERMRDWDDRIRAMLGPYTSAAIDDTTYRVDRPDQIFQMPVMPQQPAPSFSAALMIAEETAVCYVENILHLIGEMREGDRTRLSRDLAFDIEVHGYPRAQARYGMSEAFFNDLRRAGGDGAEILARRIAPRIAELLLSSPKKARGAA